MGLAGFEPATLGLADKSAKNPSPKPGTLSRLDYRPMNMNKSLYTSSIRNIKLLYFYCVFQKNLC